jgi:hypothetical protein
MAFLHLLFDKYFYSRATTGAAAAAAAASPSAFCPEAGTLHQCLLASHIADAAATSTRARSGLFLTCENDADLT